MGSVAPGALAAFDFDHTLSSRDNLLPFLRLVAGDLAVLRASARVIPSLVAAALHDDRRDAAKVAVLRHLLGGRLAGEVEAKGEAFAQDLVASHLRDDVLARLRWHQARGHATVVVSASLGCYLRPVGRALGLDGVLCSEVAVGTDGRLTGTLLGVNVRRAEKAHRLDAWIAEHRGRVAPAVWAYGDSTGDAELLARADHPVRVGRARLDPISVGDSSTA